MVDKFTRIVGAGDNKLEWWTRPYILREWGQGSFRITFTGKRCIYHVKHNPLEVGSDAKRTANRGDRDNTYLQAFHPCRLSSEGYPLTSLSYFTKRNRGNAARYGKIRTRVNRYFPATDLVRISLRAEINTAQDFQML